jgi:hypothetical protein
MGTSESLMTSTDRRGSCPELDPAAGARVPLHYHTIVRPLYTTTPRRSPRRIQVGEDDRWHARRAASAQRSSRQRGATSLDAGETTGQAELRTAAVWRRSAEGEREREEAVAPTSRERAWGEEAAPVHRRRL